MDTGQYDILLKVGSKDRKKALKLGNEIVNDLLSAITFTKRNTKGSPQFKKNLSKIEKNLWRCLK